MRIWTGVATGPKVAKSLSLADGSNADKQAYRRNDGAEEFQNQRLDGLWFSIVRLSLWFRFSCMQETRRGWPLDALGLSPKERARALAHGKSSQQWEDETRADGDVMPLEGGAPKRSDGRNGDMLFVSTLKRRLSLAPVLAFFLQYGETSECSSLVNSTV